MVNLFVTDYTINTMLEACASTQKWIDIGPILKEWFNIYQLRTTHLGLLIPGLVRHYGIQDVDMRI